ncbi:MAG TPA: DUF6286 domain-containing protein [Acidimicrobiales bacterium]|nr:DUF6286 domain-containing protein [Acidimicrobiales bacterium]
MRVANRLVSALLALALIVAGVVVAVEIVLASLGQPPWLLAWHDWHHWALAHSWTAAPVRATLWGLCVAGALLFMLAFARQPVELDTDSSDPQVKAQIRRSSLETSLRRAAQQVDGIASARVRVSRQKVQATARSRRRDTTGLPEAVKDTVSHRLRAFHLTDEPAVHVRVDPRRD